MPSIPSVVGSGRRMLARHLNRLSETLENFIGRLREAVSSAAGETVSGIVRDTVRAVLADDSTFAPSRKRYVPPRPHWERSENAEDDPWFDDRDDYLTEEDEPPARSNAQPAKPSRWPQAIAVGFHTTVNWLRRGAGRYPVLTAVAVGVLTAAATYAGGPLAAAVVGLAGSTFNVMSLANLIHAGADALAAFGTS